MRKTQKFNFDAVINNEIFNELKQNFSDKYITAQEIRRYDVYRPDVLPTELIKKFDLYGIKMAKFHVTPSYIEIKYHNDINF